MFPSHDRWGYELVNKKKKGGTGPEGFRTEEYDKQYRREKQKQWALNNPNYQKQWVINNPNKRKEYQKRANEKHKEYQKQWYLANKEKRNEYMKQWYLENKK